MRRGDGSDNSMEQSLTDAESQQQWQMFDKGDILYCLIVAKKCFLGHTLKPF